VHLECDAHRAIVAARVVRCAVAAIDAEVGVTYRAALAFNELCEWIRDAATTQGTTCPPRPPFHRLLQEGQRGMSYPRSASSAPACL